MTLFTLKGQLVRDVIQKSSGNQCKMALLYVNSPACKDRLTGHNDGYHVMAGNQ